MKTARKRWTGSFELSFFFTPSCQPLRHLPRDLGRIYNGNSYYYSCLSPCSSLREIVVGKEPRICTWGRKKDCARFLRSSTIWKEEIEEREKYKHENIPWCASLVVINLLNAGSTRHEKKLSTFYRLKQSSFSTNVVTFNPHEKYAFTSNDYRYTYSLRIYMRSCFAYSCPNII